MSGQVVEAVEAILDEVLDLRYQAAGDPEGRVSLPGVAATPQVILESLLRVRRRLDRVEELLGILIRLRGKMRRNAETLAATAEEKWDEALTGDPRNSQGFVAPKEKYANANMASMTDRRKALLARDALSRVEEALEITRTAHKGLDSLRYDHVTLIRAATVMTSLEG